MEAVGKLFNSDLESTFFLNGVNLNLKPKKLHISFENKFISLKKLRQMLVKNSATFLKTAKFGFCS